MAAPSFLIDNIPANPNNNHLKLHSQTSFKSKSKRSDQSIHNISQDNVILTNDHHNHQPHYHHHKSSSTSTLPDDQNIKKPPIVKHKQHQPHSITTKDLDKTPPTVHPEKINLTTLLISKPVTASNYKQRLSPKHSNSNPLSPKVSPYTKVNENKNMLHKLGDVSPNDFISKNLFSQFLTKADVLNFINPKSMEKLDSAEEKVNQIKHNSSTSAKKDNLTSHRGSVSSYLNQYKERELYNELNDQYYKRKLDFKEDYDNSNQITDYRTKININNVLFDINPNIQPKKKTEFRELGQNFDIISDKVHKLTLFDGFGRASNNVQANIANSKMNYKPEKTENDIPIKQPVSGFLTKGINVSSSTQNVNYKKEICGGADLQAISLSGLSVITEDKSKNVANKSQMMNTILDLKNTVHEKELEILDLKNIKLKYDMENQTLLHQMKDIIVENKKLEEVIDKMKQTHTNQEKEIDYLQVA